MKEIFKDVFSDITGGAGITAIGVPMAVDLNDWLRLLLSFGGAVLLYFSIRYKILLYKDLKQKQENEKHFKGR